MYPTFNFQDHGNELFSSSTSLDESLNKTDQGKNKYKAKSRLYHCENPSKGVLEFEFGGHFQELGLGYHQHEVKPN